MVFVQLQSMKWLCLCEVGVKEGLSPGHLHPTLMDTTATIISIVTSMQ